MSRATYNRLRDSEDASERKSFHGSDERELFPFSRSSLPRWFNLRNLGIAGGLMILTSMIAGLIHARRTYQTSLEGSSFNMTSNPYRIAKVSMLYGSDNDVYERALQSHIRHADRWGYPTWIYREDSGCGFWNKPTFLMSLVTKELAKPEKDRMEWLMWVDADSIILNPIIPAHIFLPPKELSHIQFVGTRDGNGLNSGIFFLRVHPWAIHMLLDSMQYPLCHKTINLGRNADQEAMARTFNRTDGGIDGTGYQNGIAYMPKRLFNAYDIEPKYQDRLINSTLQHFPSWSLRHAYQGTKGDFLVHFPGVKKKERLPLMSDWLDMVENHLDDWAVPYENTTYGQNTTRYWNLYASAVELVQHTGQNSGENASSVNVDLAEAVRNLTVALNVEADKETRIVEYIQAVKDRIPEQLA